MSVVQARDGVIGISPLERPDVGLVTAIRDAGALGVLDVGRDPSVARRALSQVSAVRIPEGVELELPPNITTVIVGEPAMIGAYLAPHRNVIAQVVSLDEAQASIAAGATGLIAKGSEAGGRIGDETTFVLVQRIVGWAGDDVPVWAQGGIGEHTAAACIAGGAAGVVLDSQLALVRESSLAAPVRTAIAAMDGSETTILFGHRVFTRPDLALGKQITSREQLTSRLGGDDLVGQLLPIGQDGAFARPSSAAQIVRGITAAIARHLALAVEHRPLAPESPFARAHGLHYPIAQGPMSRVSDRARFAAAVAEAGGLPFLALTLMSGPEVRELLIETKALVGDRPWGVGILGFVPQEVREAQLEVIREINPPIALIAGGRPSQATPLESQGTATYLHVPSPGLLDLFLKDGARRFVFEGSECGGHVGPRTSFVLWQQQIARLLADENAGVCDVLFAGGIHDARSAAMIAAMVAPLAARGARVGVLMGTAYLFTHEAVECGAIEPGFQRQALECDRTVLLETSPGHSTRCADTAYVDAFTRERQRLEAAGVGVKDAWAQLEQLNLGRLRIAAKGLRREGDRVDSVDDATQQREGMYMIGQVAALRDKTLSIAELHEQVSVGGTQFLRSYEGASVDSRVTDIAIVGVAAIFPGAPDTDAFWANIVAGKSAITEVPADRWDTATYYDPNATGLDAGRKTPCKWGGFLADVPFDPLAYGIPPKSLQAIEPVQLLALEIAKRALADAGYVDRAFDRTRTSVIFGAEAGTDLSSAYSFRALFPHYVGALPDQLEASLPVLSEDSFPGVLSNVIAGRIANRLDLGGVNYTVDAACAASLAALDMAVKELVAGSSDMVLCGGADLHNSINDYLMFSSVHALSPSGQCHTFDASADGIVLGEGVACCVLKRLADAERDGDRVYAVIKGVAGASDGKSLGLTAPRKEGQVRALERAYAAAGVSPSQVGLVEAHGTGTVVGDRTELATLTDVYTSAGANAGTCVLGSVKSQIGHTKCAAGMAGLIKAALSIHHGVLPPTLNVKQPSSAWSKDTSPFMFLDKSRPWIAEERIAAVSAFGFGGTNFHAVLAQHRSGDTQASHEWPAELFLVRDFATIERAAASGARLRDLARTVARGSGPIVAAIVADSLEDLRVKLAQAKRGETSKDVWSKGVSGKVAFLCPGQGSQKPGMLVELFVAFPRLHRLLELGAPWAATMLPPSAFGSIDRAAQIAALTDTRVAQPALGMADLAVAELLASCGVTPDMIAGHSYGELVALAIAGAFSEADLLALSAARGAAIVEAAAGEPGTMAAVAADGEAVEALIEGTGAVVANHNSTKQTVISGSEPAIAAALARCSEAKIGAKKIAVACAFHSPIVAGAHRALADHLEQLEISGPQLPVWSNTTAAPYPSSPEAVRALLAAQVAQPVRWAQQVRGMYEAGARVFVEVGPGQVLTKLVGDILGDKPHVAIACDAGEGGVKSLLRAFAALAASGVELDLEALFQHRDALIVDLAAPAAKQKSWFVNGHRAWPASGERPVAQVPMGFPTTIVQAPAPAAAAQRSRRRRDRVPAHDADDDHVAARHHARVSRGDPTDGRDRGRARDRYRPDGGPAGGGDADRGEARPRRPGRPTRSDAARDLDRQRAHRISDRDARHRSRSRGGPQHRFDQAHRDHRRARAAARAADRWPRWRRRARRGARDKEDAARPGRVVGRATRYFEASTCRAERDRDDGRRSSADRSALRGAVECGATLSSRA